MISEYAYNFLMKELEGASAYSGGELRTAMGGIVEHLTDLIWGELQKKYPQVDAKIVPGPTSPLTITDGCGNYITESVDRHCYIDGQLVLAIECKTYLDKCFMQRADSDFHLMKTSNSFDAIIVSLENAIADISYNFFMNQHNIDQTFFLSDVKRNSARHISRHRENIKFLLIEPLINKMESYFINKAEKNKFI